MQTETKTDIEVIQELLAIYSSRKEVIEKLEPTAKEGSFLQTLRRHKQQTDQFIEQLMDELSLHGDAVLSDVNRNNSYLEAVKEISPEKSAEENEQDYELAEQKLKDYYKAVSSQPSPEPASLEKLLQQQMNSL